MYQDYFGLNEPPFKITPNTEFFYSGGERGAVLDALVYAVAHGEGIVKVSGEVGSGKTMLCRMLEEQLPEQVERVFLANPNVLPEEVVQQIAYELQLEIAEPRGRAQSMQALQAYLLQCHEQNRQVVVFVDEAQAMPLATLEEIRLLSNLETRHQKLLQIVLFGQPELDSKLALPQIRQLRERITHSFDLTPLNGRDAGEYLMFRLRRAGYHGPDLFSPRVLKEIARASGGLVRRLNILADKTLLAAYADGTHTVSLRHVRSAKRDAEFNRAPKLVDWLSGLFGRRF